MMKKMIQNIRLKLFITTHTLGYTEDYIKTLYKIYLNHNKIIHFRDGYPVYSLSTPALFSKPMTNLIARTFYKSVQNKNMPNLLSFAINDNCNAKCHHCSFYNGIEDKKRKIITYDQAKIIIKNAQDLGVSVINFVGGEPLLRKDLPKILQAVNKDLSSTTLFTNGLLLKNQAKILKQSGLDGVYISLDSAEAKKHDIIRNTKGLFKKAGDGIISALKSGLTTGISTIITEEDFINDKLQKMVEFSKKIGVHELLVFDAIPTGRLKNKKNLIGNTKWIDRMIDSVESYNKSPSYPGILIYAYTYSHKSVGCAGGTSYFYISPYGDMMPCDFNHIAFGNVLTEPMHQVWEKMSNSKYFFKSSWNGCKMKYETALKKGYAATQYDTANNRHI